MARRSDTTKEDEEEEEQGRMSKERKSVRGGRAHDGVGDGEWQRLVEFD